MRIDWNGKDWDAIDHRGSLAYDFFNRFFRTLLPRLPPGFNIVYRAWQKPSDRVDMRNITSRTVLLLWGERATARPPSCTQTAAITLKPFCPVAWVGPRILPLPNEYFHMPSAPETGENPVSARGIDAFFSGNFNRRRVDFYRGLEGSLPAYPRVASCYPENGLETFAAKCESVLIHRWLKRSLIREHRMDPLDVQIEFTDGFAKGMPWFRYWETMRNSKVAICPPGFMSTETIRLVEASRAGTIVVTEELPDYDFYRGGPFVICRDWRNIRAVVADVLRMPASAQDALGREHRRWFEAKLAPERLAEWICGTVSAMTQP